MTGVLRSTGQWELGGHQPALARKDTIFSRRVITLKKKKKVEEGLLSPNPRKIGNQNTVFKAQ